MALRRLGDKPSYEPMMAWFGATLDLNRALDFSMALDLKETI